jgi:hypothetical protein
MNKITGNTIKMALSDMRDDLRSGTVDVRYGKLEEIVSEYFVLPKGAPFDNTLFKNSAVTRFRTLFAVPNLGDETVGDVWPTAAEYARALQNFINRRKNPWAHVTGGAPTTLEDIQAQQSV